MRHLTWPSVVFRTMRAALAVGVVAAGLAGAGCAKKVVAAPPPPPPLVVPVVPPRLVGPVVVEDEAPLPVADAPDPAPPRPASRPTRTASRAPGDGAVKPEPAPVEGQSRPDAPAEPTPAAPAEPLLRTPETANDSEAVKRVREILGRAEQNLSKVDFRTLTPNGRAQADTARRFITQADAALKNRSLTFARYLADKAETLSTSLLNR